MTSIADIRAGFPQKELPQLGTINSHPTNVTVRCWQTALNACATTSPSILAGGIYGHSFLTMKPSLFHTISGLHVPKTPDLTPPDPPPLMITATREVAAKDVTEVMLLSEEKSGSTGPLSTSPTTTQWQRSPPSSQIHFRTSTTWSYTTRT